MGTLILISGISMGSQPALSAAKPKATRSAKKAVKPKPRKPAAGSPFQFTPKTLELGPGETDLVEVRLANPYGHPTVGRLRLDPDTGLSLSKDAWDGPLPPWGIKFYTKVTAQADATGDKNIGLSYFVDRAGDFSSSFKVQVMKPIEIEVTPDYKNEVVRIKVHNLLQHRTERGRVSLKNPDRLLQDQVSALLPPIAPGETEEVTIPVMAYGIAPGAAYHFDVTVETWPGYKETSSHNLVFYRGRR
jgi:hypothetical protein